MGGYIVQHVTRVYECHECFFENYQAPLSSDLYVMIGIFDAHVTSRSWLRMMHDARLLQEIACVHGFAEVGRAIPVYAE